MLRTIANAFSVADIRKKLAFTAAMLLLYRLGAYIPAPGVDLEAVKELQKLRERVDGCGAVADQNDWIIDCTAQAQIRGFIDLLITNLSN